MRTPPSRLPIPLLLFVLTYVLGASAAAWADPGRIRFPDFDGLASKAVNTVDIRLDPSLLKLASQFVPHDSNGPPVQSLVSGLKGIYVRSFQFATDYAYPRRDVEQVLKQLDAPGWSRLVQVHNSAQHQDVDVYLYRQGKRVEGLVVVTAQPRQLTIVNIVGSITLAQLSRLQGQFGVPALPPASKAGTP